MKNLGVLLICTAMLLPIFSTGGGVHGRPDDGAHGDAAATSLSSSQGHIGPVSWWVDTVDTEGNTGRYNSVAVDSQGWPHISYCREDDGGYVKYARWTDCAWETAILAEGSGGENGNMLATAIALDDQDNPYIAYARPPGEVICTRWNGEQWIYDTVYVGDGVYGSVGIALDANQHPHISYSDGYGARRMRYAFWDGTAWHNEVVDPEGIGGVHNTLMLDADGRPHVAYTNVAHRTIRYAMRNENGIWQAETVDTGASGYLLYPAVDVGVDGRPHIGYYDTGSYDLKYAYKAQGTWRRETVISGENVCYSYSLALDIHDSPHFMCQDVDAKDLIYVYQEGDTWTHETVDAEGAVGCCSDIVFDAHDRACISYRDEGMGDLKFARAQTLSLELSEPQPGVYFHNTKLMSFPVPVAFGPVDIMVVIEDNVNDIVSLQIYVNGEAKTRLDEAPYTWRFAEPAYGKCCTVAVSHDTAGDYGIAATTIWKFF